MESKRTATTYFIPPGKFLLMENALGNPDLIQSSVSSDCRVTIVDLENFPLDDLEQWPTFRLISSDIKLKLGEGKYHIYIVVPAADNTESTSAFISYNTQLVDRKGYAQDGTLLGKSGFRYYPCGTVSKRGGNPSATTIPSGQGRLVEMDLGVTPAVTNLPGNLSDLEEVFQIEKTDPSNPSSWLMTIVGTVKSMTARIIRVTSSLIFGSGENERPLVGVAVREDATTPGMISDTIIATTAWVDAQFEHLDDRYLSKVKDDRTPFNLGVEKNLSVGGTMSVGSNTTISGKTTSKDKITAERGIQIGESFVSGILTGSGGFFDENANGEVESLIIRRFLEVPELRYNRVQVTLGDKWNAPGAGVIERVIPDSDTTGTVFLKLEEGEYGAIEVGDICMGIFHSMNSAENATEDSDDSYGNFQFAGFYTCYFTITEITGKDNKKFRYQMRPVSDRWKLTIHPSEAMTFVCYGSFVREDRQTSVYTTRTYTRLLKNQNTWEINASNIAMQYGDMTNMNVHGLDMTGYSMYLNNIYMTGTLKQVKPDGTPVNVANDRENWVSGTVYDYYDRVSHNGSLWLCINENGTNTEPNEGDSSWLCQVKSGSSITSAGRWESKNTPYPINSIVTFADKVWISNKETSNPPFGTYTDKDGNRLVYKEGGYMLVETLIQSEDWNLLLDAPQLTDGKDGESLQVRYSSDKSNWHSTFVEGDVWMQQRVGEGSVWSDAIRIVGESGSAGADGTYYDYQFAVNDSLDIAPTTGWQDTPPSVGIGQYLWMRTRLVNPNTSEENPWSVARIGGEKGEQGDSVSNMGAWKTGMAVPYLGIVTMGGKTFISKVATNNPPMWTFTDKDANRFIFPNGGYILTGELNTDEYDLVMQDGKDGRDGKDGDKGDKGEKGDKGDQGKQGIQGCIMRDSEWALNTEYRNDESLTSGTRYIDVVLVRDDSTESGWDAYKCKKTHVSSIDSVPPDEIYWEEFGVNVNAIFTSLIIAKNAKIKFLQGNQLLIQKSNGTVTAGMSGSEEGDKIRFWAGSDVPYNAPFRVDEKGNIIAEKGIFGGYLKTTLVDIDNSDATPVPSKYDSENFSAYRLNKNVYVDATFCEVVLPCSEDYSGVRVIIMDTYYTKSRVATKPTLIRTEDGSKIACGLLNTVPLTGKYLVNAIQIDCGTVELIYKSYENENGIKENGWIVISQSCGTFEEFNGIGYN